MNFSIVAGNYDVSTPTFDINGSSNLTIFKDGVYRYDLFMYNSNRGSYTNLYELQATVMRIAGEIPDPLLTTNTILDVRIPDMWGTSSNTAFPQWMPASQIFSYGAGAFPGVGASELEVKCRALLAGAGTADNDVIVLGVITRLGDSYS